MIQYLIKRKLKKKMHVLEKFQVDENSIKYFNNISMPVR